MNAEQPDINQLMAQLAEMRQEITQLKNALGNVETKSNPTLARNTTTAPTNRRRVLKNLAVLTGLAATVGIASQTEVAKADVLINPSSNIGAIILPKGGTVTGTLPTNRKFGLLATANAALDLSSLVSGPGMAAILGQGKNGLAGVLGTSDANIGVYARSDSSSALHALSENGIGVYAHSVYGEYAVHALNDTGTGVYARSVNGGYGLHAIGEANTAIYAENNSAVAYHAIYAKSREGIAILAESPKNIGVQGKSNSNPGVSGKSVSSTGVEGSSNTGYGVHGYNVSGTGKAGVWGSSVEGIGVKAQSNDGAPFQIVQSNEPSAGMRDIGQMYVNAYGDLFVYTNNGWRQVLYDLD